MIFFFIYQFLATVSHEIRTPMNGILGNFKILSLSPSPPLKVTFFHTFYFLITDAIIILHLTVGMLGLLLSTELSSTQRDYAQTAQACGKALIALINEVLDRAKIEAGKLELEAVPFDLRSILDDVLSLFSEKSRHKGLEVCVVVAIPIAKTWRSFWFI